jgi:hypothetical protein
MNQLSAISYQFILLKLHLASASAFSFVPNKLKAES